MHPGGILVVDFLSDLVGACPIATPLVPERPQERRKVRWWVMSVTTAAWLTNFV